MIQSSTTQPQITDDTELADLARAYEPERYLAATLASGPRRAALIALAAFAADLARIAATASEPVLGEIRLQWWRDSLAAMAAGTRIGSPLADALGDAMRTYALPAPMLTAMTEARAWDLYDDPLGETSALDGYLSKTEAIPFELALRVLGLAAGDAGAIAWPAGRVFGMARLLVRLPHHLAAGRQPLPDTVLSSFGVSAEALLKGDDGPAVRKMVEALAAEVADELAALRGQVAALAAAPRTGLLPLAVVPAYLQVINRRQRHPLRDTAPIAPFTLAWRIGMAHLRGRV